MLCPNCGNDNPVGRAFCTVCGRELPVAGVGTLDLDARAGREPESDPLWPQETVFVFEEEPDAVLELPAPLAAFEDAQADDVFEQSLSGVKLEDLIEEEEQALRREAERAPAESEPPASPVAETISEPWVPIPQTPVEIEEPPAIVEAETPPETANEPVVSTPGVERKRRPILKAFASILLLLAVFAGGAAAGFWYAAENLPSIQTPPEGPPPAEQLVSTRPAAPDGMVFIPGGDFLMGSDDAEALSRPAHFVSLKPYFIDRTEVTNEQYRKFVEATGYDPPAAWKDGSFPAGEERFPVTGVAWYDAAAYAAWAGKRLPTEAEWEFAARGVEGRKYPWGDEWDASLANVNGTLKTLRVVGDGAATPLGVFDMAGNAWEWTASDARAYPGGKEFPWSRLRMKIIRGGSFKSNAESAAATFRGFYGASGEKDYGSTGFRCVKDITN